MTMAQPLDYRVVSIGTLATHPLWNEHTEVRTGHATTTLLCSGSATILIDPSLPAQALLARLSERCGRDPSEITHVFLTSADPLHRRALGAFPNAKWFAHEPELDAATERLADQLTEASDCGDKELAAVLRTHLSILKKCKPAPDSLAEGVDLFPLPGVTPGCCGLLLPLPRATGCICGDAVATCEHLVEGKVLLESFDIEQAQESFAEVVQVADLLIPGRDNLTLNPLRPPFGL